MWGLALVLVVLAVYMGLGECLSLFESMEVRRDYRRRLVVAGNRHKIKVNW